MKMLMVICPEDRRDQTAALVERHGIRAFTELPQVIGEIETNQGVNAGDAETVQNPNGVVNNYFPISRVDDELDARQLARLVAAEMARMPSR